jgi:hypothetical protein
LSRLFEAQQLEFRKEFQAIITEQISEIASWYQKLPNDAFFFVFFTVI